ncbi:MAG: signal peptidase II [Planctomycetes bacterium]|nr:signal peptidase II [Planctomycetota bacterium]
MTWLHKARPFFLVVAAAVVALDLWSKEWFFDWLSVPEFDTPAAAAEFREHHNGREPASSLEVFHWQRERYERALSAERQLLGDKADGRPRKYQRVVSPAWFDFTASMNAGAFASWLAGHRVLLLVLASAAAALIVLYLARWAAPGRLAETAVGLVFGGAVGNLWDRWTLGAVRDFVHVHYYDYSWPIFNVADSAVTVGVAALMIQEFFRAKPEAEPSSEAAAPVAIAASSPAAGSAGIVTASSPAPAAGAARGAAGERPSQSAPVAAAGAAAVSPCCASRDVKQPAATDPVAGGAGAGRAASAVKEGVEADTAMLLAGALAARAVATEADAGTDLSDVDRGAEADLSESDATDGDSDGDVGQ